MPVKTVRVHIFLNVSLLGFLFVCFAYRWIRQMKNNQEQINRGQYYVHVDMSTTEGTQSGHTYTQNHLCQMHTQPLTHTCTHTDTQASKQDLLADQLMLGTFEGSISAGVSWAAQTRTRTRLSNRTFILWLSTSFFYGIWGRPSSWRECALVPLFIGYVPWRNTYWSNVVNHTITVT